MKFKKLSSDDFPSREEQEFLSDLVSLTGQEVMKPGLERLEIAMKELGLWQWRLLPKVITVAGTNGKGETSHASAYLLNQRGKQVGLWTSPHVMSVTERFCFSREGELENIALNRLEQQLQQINSTVSVALSFYETLLVAFFLEAKSRQCEYLVMEVGLGGRLDGVNILEADVVGLVSISRDHQEYLGNSYQKILGEKVQVVRSKTQLFSTLSSVYLNCELQLWQQRIGFHWENLTEDSDSLTFSDTNQALALKMVASLLGEKEKLTLKDFLYQNRLSLSWGDRELYFIGSHNPQGIYQLMKSQKNEREQTLFLVAFSRRRDADLLAMLKILGHHKKKVFLSSFEHFKGLSEYKLNQLCQMSEQTSQLIAANHWKILNAEDLNAFFRQPAEDIPRKVFITGSYYFIAYIIQSFSPIIR